MKIGNLEIENRVFLAPMAGITDKPFRLLCKEQGAGLVFTEMVSAKGMYYNDKKTIELTDTYEEEGKVGVQIFGKEPDIMADVTEKLNETNLAIIDINMGCPAPKVTKNGEGSALMLNPPLVEEIVKSVVRFFTTRFAVHYIRYYPLFSITFKVIEKAAVSFPTVVYYIYVCKSGFTTRYCITTCP